MKCKGCKKLISDTTSTFFKGGEYYHNEICYLNSITTDYNKKINDMLKYYFSFNGRSEVPKNYYIMFNKLKKEVDNLKYVMYFLYNSRDEIYNINSRYQYVKASTRQYKVWEYLKDNIYFMLPDFVKKEIEIERSNEEIKEQVIYDTEVKIKKRHKNKLLED